MASGPFYVCRPTSPSFVGLTSFCAATRSPRSGRRPSRSPQDARRRRRLPGGAGLAPRSRSPPAPRRCGEQPRRPIRLDLRPGSPPSVSPFEIPLPAADQRQGPLDRLWRSRPQSRPGVISPLKMIIIKGGHRRGGTGGYISVSSLRRRETRSSGRADQDGGGGAPRADPTAEQPLAARRNSRGSRWPPACAPLALGNASLADCCRGLALRKRSILPRITPLPPGGGEHH